MTMGEMRDRKPELHGVGGWLTFLCVSLLLLTPGGAGIEMLAQNVDLTDKAAIVAADIALGAFSIFTGVGLVRT
jgi:hypothetical protein